MAAWASTFLAALVSAPAVIAGNLPSRGFDACPENFHQSFVPRPVSAKADTRGQLRELCFNGFAVLHSGQTKTPVFTAEHLTPARLAEAKGEKRTNRFYEEARLPSAERARLEDYKGSGLARGHMAPAADMPDPESMAQSFSLANMVPQAPENNSGIWATAVEKATRKYVERGNEVYVITGPIYRGQVQTIGPNRVWVPTALFKLVYDPAKKKAWAYVVDNKNDATLNGPISYKELVSRTGYYFLQSGAVTN